MGTIISPDGRFEWDEAKNILNKEDHGFYFEEILGVFDDPFFLEAYDRDHSNMDEIRMKGSIMTKTTGNKLPVMSDERIAELQNFKTKDFSDCPVQTQEQLQEFKPKYPNARLYKPIKQVVQIRLDADVLEWLKQDGPGYQTRANNILRQAMLQAN